MSPKNWELCCSACCSISACSSGVGSGLMFGRTVYHICARAEFVSAITLNIPTMALMWFLLAWLSVWSSDMTCLATINMYEAENLHAFLQHIQLSPSEHRSPYRSRPSIIFSSRQSSFNKMNISTSIKLKK